MISYTMPAKKCGFLLSTNLNPCFLADIVFLTPSFLSKIMTYLQCHDVVIHLWKLIPSSPSWPKGTEMVPFVVLLTFLFMLFIFLLKKKGISQKMIKKTTK